MKIHLPFILLLSFLCSCMSGRETKLQVSGIYPHLAVFNPKFETDKPGETGIGAVMPWAGKLWALTYPAHKPFGSGDLLYSIDNQMNMEAFKGSVGGTHANRMIHKESNQLIIGPYFIDSTGNVRVISPQTMPGRLTATARHLTDPANKVYFYTMEEGLYEVDVHSLKVKEIYPDGNNRKPVDIAGPLLPGYHGKGAYTSQGRLVVANNGEYNWQNTTESGCLAEWNGENWTIIERKQFTEVTGNKNLWTIGWDEKSLILKVMQEGSWYDFRLPKASFTYDGKHGWHTEWPRIRDIDQNWWLMTMHGMFWQFNPDFDPMHPKGIQPISSYLKVIPDFCEWNGQLVFACDDASMFDNSFVGQPQSNFWFTPTQGLKNLGPRQGYGSVWLHEKVEAGMVSEPFLVEGFDYVMIVGGVGHEGRNAGGEEGKFTEVKVKIEGFDSKLGTWRGMDEILLKSDQGAYKIFEPAEGLEWVRMVTSETVSDLTLTLHLTSEYGNRENSGDSLIFQSLAGIHSPGFRMGLLRPSEDSCRVLEWVSPLVNDASIKSEPSLFEIDEKLTIEPVDNLARIEQLQAMLRINNCQLGMDSASVYFLGDNGRKYRLPYGDRAYQNLGIPLRGIREVATERSLMNIGGLFYELPRDISGGIYKVKPITTHNKIIADFCSWRGLMVMAGTLPDAQADDHYFESKDGYGLWFGSIDDLWKFGKPYGEGGPWYHTEIIGNSPSDPYLMTGFDHKELIFNQKGADEIVLTLEADFTATGDWTKILEVTVKEKEEFKYNFPTGFSAHWVRLTCDKNCRASAEFRYF